MENVHEGYSSEDWQFKCRICNTTVVLLVLNVLRLCELKMAATVRIQKEDEKLKIICSLGRSKVRNKGRN